MKSIKSKQLIFSGIVVIVCSAIMLFKAYQHVISNTEDLTKRQLSLALNFDLAIREYVADTIRPMVVSLVDEQRFIPEAMSTSFVAAMFLKRFEKTFRNTLSNLLPTIPETP